MASAATGERPAKALRRASAAAAHRDGLRPWQPHERWWHSGVALPAQLQAMRDAAAAGLDEAIPTLPHRQLSQRGYTCLRGVIAWVDAEYLSRFDRETTREGHIGRENRRKIAALDPPLLGTATLKIHAALEAFNLKRQRKQREQIKMLDSLPGCERQRPHWDFDQPRLASMDDNEIPLSVVVALEGGTTFHFYPPGMPTDGEGIVISLEAGDMVVFRGDLLHAGAGYEVRNRRLHMYLDHHNDSVAAQCRVSNLTYYPQGS